MKTPKERLEMHIQIVQSNARKLREWETRKDSYSWKEQVEIRILNIAIAEEAMREMIEMGVIA